MKLYVNFYGKMKLPLLLSSKITNEWLILNIFGRKKEETILSITVKTAAYPYLRIEKVSLS